MSSLTRLLKVALIGICTLAAAGCGASDVLVGGEHTIVAQFDNGAGLYQGNTVAVLGIPIGKITKIEPHGTMVEVTMKVDADTPLPADVTAVTLSTSVLTDRHVELTPVYRSGPKLPDHAFIPLNRTHTPVEFDRLLTMADSMSKQLGGDGEGGGPVADLLTVSSGIVDGNGPAIRDALTKLSTALRTGDNPAATRDAIVTLVRNLDSLTTAAAANDRTIREFGSGIHQLSDLLAEQDLGQGQTGAQLTQILAQAEDLLAKNRAPIKQTAADAQILTKALADYQRELSEFLNVTPMLLDNAYNSVNQVAGQVRVHTFVDRIVFDQQMIKEVCNLAQLHELGCATGKPQDFGPDFGITAMLATMAGVTPQ